MAVGVIDAIAVFGVLAAAVAIAPLTIAAVAAAAAVATDVAAVVVVVVVIFGFFLIDLPNHRSNNQRFFDHNVKIFGHIKLSMVYVCVRTRVCDDDFWFIKGFRRICVHIYVCMWMGVCVFVNRADKLVQLGKERKEEEEKKNNKSSLKLFDGATYICMNRFLIFLLFQNYAQ